MPSLPQPDGFNSQVKRLVERLGYLQDPDFITDPSAVQFGQTAHAVRAAFERLAILGAFCPRSSVGSGASRNIPVVYVAAADDLQMANAIHRSVWSQSLVPLLLIATPDGFQIRNGFDYRTESQTWSWETIEEDQLPAALASLTASALRSAASWRDFNVPTRVDERLGRSVRELSAVISKRSEQLRERPDIINATVGRFLYLYVLVDRGVIDQGWVNSLKLKNGKPACPSVCLSESVTPGAQPPAPWLDHEVWGLFDAIDDVLNGSIFPLTKAERTLLDTDTLHFIRRALRSDQVEGETYQYCFLDVDYSTIRTETISALYECFFELEAGDQKKAEGAFYTPPFLVDYIVDETDFLKPIRRESLLVDPACGSGAFLVAGYRRIIESLRSEGTAPSADLLYDVLASSISGIEIKRQAANVARFSLYLTMLDYLPEVTLRHVPNLMRGRRLFPDLTKRLVVGDAFDQLPRQMRGRASHVLGNPPWTKVPNGSLAEAYRSLISNNKGPALVTGSDGMAELFYWRSIRELCAADGCVAMVLPTKSFISPSARVFPQALAAHTTISGITNLAHFRERLFATAREAATVVFATPSQPSPLHWTWRYSPKASSQPVGKDGMPWAIVVDRGQVERFRQSDLLVEGHEWFRDLMLQPLDRQLAHSLTKPRAGTRPMSIGGFMDQHGIVVKRGGSPAETGLPPEFLLNTKSNDFRTRLGIYPGSQRNYYINPEVLDKVRSSYREAFAGPMLLMPRSQAGVLLIDHPAAYSSSLLGIYFTSNEMDTNKKLAVLREIGAYPSTSVGRYLLALFGRLWVFDQRRFEADDLRKLPFPYRDADDLLDNPVTHFDDADFTAFCQERFGDNSLFGLAVTEHHNLREKYQDGKRPAEGSARTVDQDRLRYRSVLLAELGKLLMETPLHYGPELRPAPDSIAFSLMMSPPFFSPDVVGIEQRIPELAEESSIELKSVGTVAVASFIKPDMRSAWTAERAYADAIGVADRILAP